MDVLITPNTIFRNFLRGLLVDISTTRSASTEWIYDDWPRETDLGDSSFPRISVLILDGNAQPLGMFDDAILDTFTIQIDCWSKKDLMTTRTKTDEALGTMVSTVNTNRFTSEFVPTSVTNVQHDTTNYGTVTLVDSDADFTTPASLSANTVEISKETGNFNFSATDVSNHDSEAITTTYDKDMEGEEVAKYLGFEVNKAVRTNWRTAATFKGLFYPVRIGGPRPIPFDEDLGIYRYNVEYRVQQFNTIEGC